MADPTIPSGSSPPDASVQPPVPGEKSSVQQRIDQLVRRAGDAERQSGALSTENEALLGQIAELTKKVEGLSRATPSGKPAASASIEGESTEELVKRAVGEALRPLFEGAETDRASAQISRQQQLSFERAAQANPKLRDQSSQDFQVFAQIFDGRPEIKSSPEGPELAYAIAKGILVDSRGEDRQRDNARTQAQIPRSAGSPLPLTGDGDDHTRAERAKTTLLERGYNKELSSQEMTDLVTLVLATSGGKK